MTYGGPVADSRLMQNAVI